MDIYTWKNYDFRIGGKRGFTWTASDFRSGGANENLPFITMKQYKQTWSATMANTKLWLVRAEHFAKGQAQDNPYKGLYIGKYQCRYVLPFYSPQHHAIQQGWVESKGPFVGELGSQVENAVKAAQVFLPSAGILFPKSYAGSQESSYSVQFSVINTVDPIAGNGHISRNKAFVDQLIMASLHTQVNCLATEPPAVYEVHIPGIRWSPVSVISNLRIDNIGNLNRIVVDGQKINIPDAWNISIGIRDLIPESTNLYNEALRLGDNIDEIKVRVFEGK